MKLFSVLLFLASTTLLCGQLEFNGQELFGGTENESFSSGHKTSDGTLVLAGLKGLDAWIVKLDAECNLEWEQTYGDPLRDSALSIVESSDQGYIAVGKKTIEDGPFTSEYAWIFKVSATGELEWENTLEEGLMKKVIALPDGNFMAAGERSVGAVWLTKFNSAGDIIWDTEYGQSAIKSVGSISLTEDEGVLLVGGSNEASPNTGTDDFWIVKLNADGDVEWENLYGGDNTDIAFSGIQTAEGNYAIVGWAQSDSTDPTHSTNGFTDAWVILLDKQGQLIRKKMLGGSQVDRATEIAQLENGTFLVAGVTGSDDFDITEHKGSEDVWVINLDENLDKIWDETYGGSGGEMVGELLYFSNSEVYMTGVTSSTDGDFSDNSGGIVAWVAKLQVLNASSTETLSSAGVSIYPNPTKDFIYIESTSAHSFLLADLHGNKIFSGLIDSSRVDISKIQSGTYLLSLYSQHNELLHIEKVLKIE